MRNKILLAIIIIVLVIVATIIYSSMNDNRNGQFEFAEIIKGDLESTISSTGTINPVGKVEVGTQVSGIIDHLYVDFNDQVRKGQLLAVLDTLNLKAAFLSAQAGLERAEAQLENAQDDYDRNMEMFKENLISEADFLPFKVNLKTQKANLKSAQADLQRAQQNLKYAYIRSPIKGTVIQRNVEAGQTVAASLQAPTLFIIAENLSKMEIHAQVDESDIGQIKEGMAVRFDVQAYPDKKFNGTVRQIRMQPEIISNVVNYTVVIDATNEDNLLLPGMTATVDFIVQQRKNVLLIPNTALRFQPSQELQTKFFENRRKQIESSPDSIRQKQGAAGRNFPMMEGTGDLTQRNTPKDVGRVWYVNEKGQLAMEIMRTGATDGRMTEIVRGRNIEEGIRVIVGIAQSAEQKRSNNLPPPGGMGRRPF
jgi:HlyD family secretion protein